MAIETPKRGILEFQQDVLKQAGGISASNLYQFDIQMGEYLKKWISKELQSEGAAEGSKTVVSEKTVDRNITRLQLECNEIQLPGVTYSGSDVKMPYKGITQKMAGNKVYNELDVSFFLDAESTALMFFRAWQDFVMNAGPTETGAPIYDPNGEYMRYNQQAFTQRYYDDYVADLMITKLEKFNRPAGTKSGGYRTGYTARIAKAYPYTVSSIPYSAGPAQLVKVTVGFYYEYSHLTYELSTVSATPPDQTSTDIKKQNENSEDTSKTKKSKLPKILRNKWVRRGVVAGGLFALGRKLF